MSNAAANDTYAIIGGGPFRKLERWLHLARGHETTLRLRVAQTVAFVYAPILLAAFLRHAQTGAWPALLREIGPQVRVFVMLPLLLVAEAMVDERASDAGRYLLRSGLVRPHRLDELRSIIARTARLRDSTMAELSIFFLTLVSLVVLPTVTRDHAIDTWWSIQPLTLMIRFLFLRLLWRWAAWGIYLSRIVRLPLACRVSHPDQVGGLSPLAGPSVNFAFAVTAIASSLAGEWADRMRFEGFVPSGHLASIAAFAIVSFVIAIAPLAVLAIPLKRLRWHGVQSLGALASRYSAAFERRWLVADGSDALGTPDIQSLNDLGGVFERVARIRIIVAPRAMIAMLLASVTVPFLPLFVAEVGATQLLAGLAKALL